MAGCDGGALFHGFTLRRRRSGASENLLWTAIKRMASTHWESAAKWLLSVEGQIVLRDPALLTGLRREINRDVETELLLTELRKELLHGPSQIFDDGAVQLFVCAMIQQCINNEYVWFVSDEERRRLDLLPATDAERRLCGQTLLVLGLYRPLHELLRLGDSGTSTHDAALAAMPSPLNTMLRGYIDAYREEAAIKASIERFGTINDGVSRIVAAMYEVYPYPRWVNLTKPAPGSRQEGLKTLLGPQHLSFLDRPFDVLVPGCGTGRKAIQIAMGFGPQARVLATDLSRSSLAYAARMAGKFQLQNIQFMQMDILDLPKFERQFDVIECTGVLVCVADPLKTWQILVDSTRAGGLVHVSLYSELARREIVRLRRDYESHLMTLDADYIRTYRRQLMLTQPDVIDVLPTRSDFFDLSRCKDLLFHPVEHRFTIPQIEEYLGALGLQFLAFEQPSLLEGHYWTAFPRAAQRRDLKRWWEFEQKYPDAFQDLYEIWSRKPVQRE